MNIVKKLLGRMTSKNQQEKSGRTRSETRHNRKNDSNKSALSFHNDLSNESSREHKREGSGGHTNSFISLDMDPNEESYVSQGSQGHQASELASLGTARRYLYELQCDANQKKPLRALRNANTEKKPAAQEENEAGLFVINEASSTRPSEPIKTEQKRRESMDKHLPSNSEATTKGQRRFLNRDQVSSSLNGAKSLHISPARSRTPLRHHKLTLDKRESGSSSSPRATKNNHLDRILARSEAYRQKNRFNLEKALRNVSTHNNASIHQSLTNTTIPLPEYPQHNNSLNSGHDITSAVTTSKNTRKIRLPSEMRSSHNRSQSTEKQNLTVSIDYQKRGRAR